MADTITLKVEVAQDGSIDKMSQDLDEMKKKLTGLKVGTKEFKALSAEVRKADSQLKDLNKSFEGLDTEALTGEFGKMAGGISGAFTGIAVLGGEANESMEAMLATVSKGMAIAQGFRGATEAMTASQRVYNQVLKENPIGLIITAIGLFIGAIVALISNGDKIIEMLDGWAEKFSFLQGPINVVKAGIQGLMDLWESVQRLILGDDAVDKAIAEKADKIRTEEAIKNTDWETKRLEAIKASEEEIYNAKRKALEDRLHLAELNGEQETDEYKQLQIDLLALDKNYTDNYKKEEDERTKKAADERYKKYLIKQQEYNDTLEIQELQKQNRDDFLEDMLKKEEEFNNLKIEAEKRFQDAWNEEFNLDEDVDIEDDPVIQRQMEINKYMEQLRIDGEKTTQEGLKKLWEKGTIDYETYINGLNALDTLRAQATTEFMDITADALNTVSGLMEENSAEQKIFASASIILSTASAIMKAIESYSSIPIYGSNNVSNFESCFISW